MKKRAIPPKTTYLTGDKKVFSSKGAQDLTCTTASVEGGEPAVERDGTEDVRTASGATREIHFVRGRQAKKDISLLCAPCSTEKVSSVGG